MPSRKSKKLDILYVRREKNENQASLYCVCACSSHFLAHQGAGHPPFLRLTFPQEPTPASASSSSTSAPSEEDLAEQSAIDCLSAYYSGEDIYSTSINGTKIEVEIMSPYSASDSAPEDWATIQSTLQQACSDLQSSMAEFEHPDGDPIFH